MCKEVQRTRKKEVLSSHFVESSRPSLTTVRLEVAYKVINITYLVGDILTDRHELDHCQLRNYENLRIPMHSTTHSQLFIRYRAIKTWNSLPGDLRRAPSLSSFRNKLKLMLHQQ